MPWEVVDSTVHWSGYSTVRVDRVTMPDGEVVEREVVEHRPAVGVLPVTEDGDVLLVRQYRHALGRTCLEVPAGGVDDDDDDARTAARRELAEEVGVAAGRLDHLAHLANSVGWSTEVTDLWLARDLSTVAPPDGYVPVHEEASMELVRLPLDEAVTAVHDGTITDAKTVVALLRAAHHMGR